MPFENEKRDAEEIFEYNKTAQERGLPLLAFDGKPIRIGDTMCFGGWAEPVGEVIGIGDMCFFTALGEDEDPDSQYGYDPGDLAVRWELTENTMSCYVHFRDEHEVIREIVSECVGKIMREGDDAHLYRDQYIEDAVSELVGCFE